MKARSSAASGTGGIAWLLPAFLLLGLVYLVPLSQVLVTSVAEPRLGLDNYVHVASDAGIRRIVWTTFRIGAIATAVSVLLGYAVAYAMVTGSPRRRAVMFVCVMVPFWISVLVRAFAWIVLLRTEGIVNDLLVALHVVEDPVDLLYNEFGVLVGMVHCLVPIAVLTLHGQMEGIDRRLMVAARGLGAGPLTVFARVFLPLSVPGLAAAAVLVFIGALGFYIIPALLGGGKVLMIAEYIGILINGTLSWGTGTALAGVLMLCVFGLLFAASRVVDLRAAFGGR